MNKKKLLALLMALVMTLSLVPVTAFAEGGNVAKIDTTEYATLAAAFTAANTGDTISLVADVDDTTLGSKGIAVAGDKTITLDLAGHNITCTDGSEASNRMITITGTTTLNVINSSTVTSTMSVCGENTKIPYGVFRNEQGTTLNITATNNNIVLENGRSNGLNVKVLGGVANLSGVVINSTTGGGIEVTEADLGNHSQIGEATLTNCIFTQSGYSDWCSTCLSVSGGSKLTVNSGSYTGENYALYVFSSGGEIEVKDGTFSGNREGLAIRAEIDLSSYSTYTGGLKISGGNFTGGYNITSPAYMSITGGTFDHDPGTYVAQGYKAVNNNGTWTVSAKDYVAQIGEGENATKYETLEDAFAAAVDGDTITLLGDASGAGIFIGSNKFTGSGLTIDFGDHTYTVTSPVGSTGTENQMLHFEQGNKITLTNGTINITDDSTKRAAFEMIMQNYCALTIDGMTIDGTGIAVAKYSDPKYQAYPGWYDTDKPQFNYNTAGNSVIRDSIITVVGDLGIDDSANVTFEDDATIRANKIATHGTDTRYTSTTSVTTVENGAKFSFDPTAVLASNQKAVLTDGLYVVTAKTPVARIGSTTYTSFVEAVTAANSLRNCTITILDDIDFSQGEYADYKWVGSNYHPIEITGENVVLDLNNHRFYNMGNFAIAIGHLLAKDGRTANVTVMNGTLEAGQTGGVTNSYVLGIAGADNAEVINVVTDGGINICTGSTATITDSTINGTKYYAVCAQTGSNVTIENSTITKNTDSSVATKAMFWVDKAGTDSDCVTASNTTGAYDASAITIKSGSFTVDSTNGGVFYLASGIKPVVEGGTFNIDPTDKGLASGYTAIANGNGTWTVGQSVTDKNITGTTESTNDTTTPINTTITPVVVTNSATSKTVVITPVADVTNANSKDKTTKIKQSALEEAANEISDAVKQEVKIITGLSATQEVGGAAAPQTVITDDYGNVIFAAEAKGGQLRMDKKIRNGGGYHGAYNIDASTKAEAIDYVDLRLQFKITLPNDVNPSAATTKWSWTLKYGTVERTVNGVNYLPVSGEANTYTSNVVVTNIPLRSYKNMDFSATLTISYEVGGVTYTITQSSEVPLTRHISDLVNYYRSSANDDESAREYANVLKQIYDDPTNS